MSKPPTRLDTTSVPRFSSSSPSPTSSPTSSSQTAPLLAHSSTYDFSSSSSPISSSSASNSSRRQSTASSTTTSRTRKRTSLYLFLVFLGILIVTIRVWNDEAVETGEVESGWRTQMVEWREWAMLNSGGPIGEAEEALTPGSEGSSEEDTSIKDALKEEVVEVGPEKEETNESSEIPVIATEPREDEPPRTPERPAEDASVVESDVEDSAPELETVPSPSATMNVRPFARFPSNDPQVKYLSFENHSGFHNQRKSLVNALVLARLLNRTLLLPPARLGSAIPWGPGNDLIDKLVFSEECKAGLHPELPIARSPNSHLIAEQQECDDPTRWTYVGWSWLVKPELFEGTKLVDRWNVSRSWFVTPLEEGGLGLEPEDIQAFADEERRSYQIYDSRETETQTGLFESRIDLDDLLQGPLAKKRLLQFGSLFSGSRLNLAKEGNQRMYEATFNGVILGNEGLEVISDEVRDRLGSYVSIHARTGSQERGSFFFRNAQSNMRAIFQNLAHSVLGIKTREVERMIRESSVPPQTRLVRRTLVDTSSFWESDFEEEDPALSLANAPIAQRSLIDRTEIEPRAHSGRPSRPLSPTLHCRKPLWPTKDKTLSRLNTPLYIATDSRSPSTEPSLKIFYDWFPCVFVLSDFITATPGVSDESVPALERLGKGGAKEWISDFDGSELGKFLFPFLEAEIAARAVETVGTKSSTFSGYTTGILHHEYESKGKLAPWDST
ncbi:hypothetical protein JCM16303_003805 [Sporobolomyces ruberrimus]